MARPGLLAAGALLIVCGGGALGYALTRHAQGGMPEQSKSEMATAVAKLDGEINAARTAVHERAMTLAGLQQVQAAIVTDAATAKDMLVRGELKFDPQPGEVVELGQSKSGANARLLIEPETGATAWATYTAHAGKVGAYLDLAAPAAKQLLVMDVVEVKPKQMADTIMGYLSIARPLDVSPAFERLAAAGVAGWIDVGSQRSDFGAAPKDATVTEVPIASAPQTKLHVYIPAITAGMPMPIALGGAGAAFVGLLLLVAGMMGGAVKPAQTLGTAQTQVSSASLSGAGMHAAAIANGTPAVGDPNTTAIPPNNFGPGAMIGRWEIVKRLGSGGMADVYLARARGEAGFEKLVALKVMHPHLMRNESAVQHFLDEARLAARIVHPNVCTIQDLGKIGNDYVIIMEFVDGVDLDKLLSCARAAQRPVPVNVALGIICRICDGLNAAHKATAPDGSALNIVHRDVKSANVLVSKQGGVKVVDFGIAKAAKQSHLTRVGETKGTPSMMAPEQRVGEQVDVRADVYSTAAVAYEILTGNGVNLDLVALAHLGIEQWPHLPTPSSLRPQLPVELDGLLLGAMSYDREKRPADSYELEAAFEAIMKKYNLTATDKDIARWVASEIALLPVGSSVETSPTASV
ncbi:MAG: pkn7 [Myxococcales bacterium]|nr:pkn7 [Myxococcales bacterium]